MIKIEQIRKLGWSPSSSGDINFYVSPSFDYGLNLKTGDFYYLNDGYGEPEFLTVVLDINHLNQLMDIYEG